MSLRRWAISFVVSGCAALASGCGGGTFDGRVYRGDGFAFRVPSVPPTWERLDVSDASIAFRDAQHGATIAVSGRCRLDGEDVPLSALTQHLFIQFTERKTLVQEVVPFDGREAMHTVMAAKLDGVEKRFDVWVMKKDGCVYDLYGIVRPERYDAFAPRFHEFVRGFGTVGGDDG